jgi:hypothetical protein
VWVDPALATIVTGEPQQRRDLNRPRGAVTQWRRRAGMLPVMSRRQQTRPSSSYLLRIHEEQVHSVVLRYELLDLAAGTTLRFASLTALQRHLRESGQRAGQRAGQPADAATVGNPDD